MTKKSTRVVDDSEYDGAPSSSSSTMKVLVEEREKEKEREALPTCQELMQRPFSPLVDGSFLTRVTTNVVWKMRQDGSRQLTLPSTCRLKRYTAQEAGQCLTNKNLLFIGDSLTRYSYFSLAYFMEHKKWPARFQAQTPCNHVDEHGNKT